MRYQPLPLIILFNRLRRTPFPKTCCNGFRRSGEEQFHGTRVGITNGWAHLRIPRHAGIHSDDNQYCDNDAASNEKCPPTPHEVRLVLYGTVEDPLPGGWVRLKERVYPRFSLASTGTAK